VLRIDPDGVQRSDKNPRSKKKCLVWSGENDLKTKDIKNVQRRASERRLNVVGTGSPRLGLHTLISGWGVRRVDRSNVPTLNP
jgi:hypothetical protein